MKTDRRSKTEILRELRALRKQINRLESDSKGKNIAKDRVRKTLTWQEALVEDSRDAIIVADVHLKIIAINSSACTLTGYSREELLSKNFSALFGGKDSNAFQEYCDQVIAGIPVMRIMRIRRNEGQEVEVEFTSRCIDIDGQSYIHSTIRNMMSRQKIGGELTILNQAMRSISEAITITDERNIIIFVNDTFLRMYGYEREELIGSPISILRIDNTLPPVDEILDATLTGGWQGELINRRKDGSTFPIWLSTSVVHDETGVPLGLVGITTDITDRKLIEQARNKAEAALRASEEFFREVAENASDIIVIVDRIGKIKYVSPSIERYLGYRMNELLGKNTIHFIHPADIRRAIADFGKAIDTKETSIPNTFRVFHRDGTERIFEGFGKNLLDHPSIAGFMMNVHDVTEKRKAETALRESRDQLRSLTVHMETVREKERKYIAHEMHEEFGQILTMIKMHMVEYAKKYSHDEAFVAGIKELSGFIDTAIDSIRKISLEMRPGILDLLGLTAAIKWQAEEFSKKHKITCNVEVPKKEIQLPEGSSIILFRMLQDALKNVADHAQASRVRIHLREEPEYLELLIEDNGKGMSEEQLNNPSSIGCVLMKERALSIGGSAEINGREGKGTTVLIHIPFTR